MDPRRFDALVKTLSRGGTRRRLLRLVPSLPLASALVAFLDDETDAAGRRKRRKKRHKHQQGEGKDNRKGEKKGKDKGKDKCRPESIAQTCAGKCATITNRCGGQVDCGPCSCGACSICQTCNSATGQCVPNAATAGQACGSTGQTCGGGGTPGVCGCTPTTCAAQGKNCGSIADGCGGTISCGGNGACCGTPNGGTRCQGGACVAATATFAECQGRCNDPGETFPATICGQPATCPACTTCGCGGGSCTGTGPNGFGNYCTSGGGLGSCSSSPCDSDQVCCGGLCKAICTT
jgi:hypothetical protein